MIRSRSTDGRLHLAVIPQNAVLPLDNGAKIRNFHLFRALAARHRVSLLLTQSPPEPCLEELTDAGMAPVSLPKPRSLFRPRADYLGSLARLAPVDFAVQTNPAIRGWLRRHADEIDAVLTGSIGPTLSIPRRYGRPVVVDTHNVEWARRASELAPGRDVPHRLRRRLFGAGTAAWERRVLRASARVYVCSADEEADLRAAGVERVVVVPNGVDLERTRPTAGPDGATVLFAGDLAYGPNVDAARWIAAEIAPAIRRLVESCRIVVAGRSASPELRAELSAAGVEVRSPVADMTETLAEASVILVPLRSGGGTRLKVLEAFGAGRAVVSTTLGAEGIAAEHGRHLLLADSPAELADATVSLLGDRGARERLTAEARRLVEERYGWRAIGAALADDVERLLT